MTAYTFSQLFDFTRTSAGSYVNSSGLVTTTPASTNLLTYTEALSNAAWTKVTTTVTADSIAAPDGTSSADTLTATGANSTTRQTFTATAVPYTFSVYLMRKTGSGNVDITVDGTTYVTQAITSEWVRYSTTLTPAAGSKTAGIRIATSGDEVYAWGAQLELGSSATTYTKNYGGLYPARFDYDPATLAAKGFLVEPQATNLLTYSEQFNNAAWPKTNCTVSADAVTSPDGTTNADKVIEDVTAPAAHAISQIITGTSGIAYTYTVYIKAAERTFAGVVFEGPNQGIYVNLTTGAFAGNFFAAPTSYSIQNAGNGWWRVSITATSTTTTTRPYVYLADTTPAYSYAGDGTSGLYVWGAQLEATAFGTSYIQTVASTATRSADNAVIQAPMFAPWYNSAAGTLVLELDMGATAASTPVLYQISDGTATNRIITSVAAAGTSMTSIITATTQQFSGANSVTYTQGSIYKVGIAATTNSAFSSVNGNVTPEDNAVTMPTVTSMRLGSSVFNSNYISGHLRTVNYYPFRVTSAQLQALTS